MGTQKLKQYFVLLGILIILLSAAIYFVWTDLKNKNEIIAEINNDLSTQSSKQLFLASMEQQVKTREDDLDKVNGSIIGTDKDVDFIENLESLAKSNNLKVSIDSLALQDDSSLTTSKVSFFNIRAKTTGDWTGTYIFLSELESLPLKVKINKINLVNTTNEVNGEVRKVGSVGNTWELDFDMTVLKMK